MDGMLTYASVHHSRGCAHAGLQSWVSALRDADKTVALRGLWLAPRLLRGRALEALGRWTAAAECYGAAEELVNSNNNRAAGAKRTATTTGEEEASTAAVVEGLRRTQEALAMRSCVARMDGHTGPVTTVAFMPPPPSVESSSSSTSSPHASRVRQILASASDDGTVRLWETPGGECRLVLHASSYVFGDPVTSLNWGPKPLHIDDDDDAAGGGGGDDYNSWCLAAATVSGALTLWHIRVSSPSRSPSPSSSSSPSHPRPSNQPTSDVNLDSPIEVTLTAEHRLLGPGGGVTALAFDAEARQLASGCEDGGCVVWSAATGEVLRAPKRRHKKAITSLAFHPTGWQMCSGSVDADARVWDLAGMTGRAPGECLHTLRWNSGKITEVSYSVCARLVVTATAAHLGPAGRGTYRLLVGLYKLNAVDPQLISTRFQPLNLSSEKLA
jgi:hypothetical protein